MSTATVTDALRDPAANAPAAAWKRLRGLVIGICLCLFAAAGAGVAVATFGARTYHWQAFEVKVGVVPAWQGQTRIILAPLGEVRAATHPAPLRVNVRLENVSFEKVKTLIARPPNRAFLEQDFVRATRRHWNHFALWQIGLGMAGGLAAPLLLRRRRTREWLLCALAGGVFVALMLASTAASFNRKAFESPTYTGSLREAPVILALARNAFSQARALSDKLRMVAANLNTLYGRISAVPGALPGDESVVRLLHVSDIHNNPLAVDFLRDLADKFGVAAVVDTGDLSDFGSPLEAELSRGLAALRVPYVFVAGNHDSQATVRTVGAANPNAVILGAGSAPAVVAGLRIAGAPDPNSARADVGSVDTPLDALRQAGEAMRETIERAGSPPPDIVCVHNPRQAEPLIGRVPLILCGHMHRAYLDTATDPATILCNAGTTGGAGLRYFDRAEGVPLSAAVLTFTRPDPEDAHRPRLLSIDLVVLDGSLSQYSISRRTFAPSAGSLPPADGPASR